MSETVPFTLQAPTALLHGLAGLPDEPGERPAVVICHGFKGFMEWGFFPALAALLAELLAVLDATGGPIAPGRVDRGRIGLAEHAAGEAELLVIPGACHTFGSRHSFAGPTPQLIQALNATQAWLREHL